MKPFSANRKPISRAKARNATLINLFATPGLGSLICKRWLEGTGQLLLALAACWEVFVWFSREMSALYSVADFNEAPIKSPGHEILEMGVMLLVVSWFWSLVTSISLIREARNQSVQTLKNFSAPARPLEANEIVVALAALANWRQNDKTISRTFQFKDFPAAMKFVNAVAEAAETAWHHPDIDIRWNKVTLTLTTHDAGGLTKKDFALAKKINELSLR